jgi:hypothetical protein
MAAKTGKDGEIRFASGSLDLAEVRRLADDMWSDLAFDEVTLARLKRDGLTLAGVRLTGPSPYMLDVVDDEQIIVTIAANVVEQGHVDTLLDLWRMHFAKGLRPGSLAA